MSQMSVYEFEWKIFENCKTVIAIDDIRGQKVAIDARVWYKTISHLPNANETKSFNLESIFRQLYCLVVEQIRVLVVFQKNDCKDFIDKSIDLLLAMGIPYMEDENVAPVFAELINKQIVDNILADDITLFIHGAKPIFKYSHFEHQIANNIQPLSLEKYFTTNTSIDLLRYFHPIASSLLHEKQFIDLSKGREPSNTRPIRSRACKKPHQTTSKNKSETCDKIEELETILKKLLEVVKGWMDDPVERMKNFQDTVKSEEFERLSEEESEFVTLYESFCGKSIYKNKISFSNIQPIELCEHQACSDIKKVEWKRAEFESLHGYVVANQIKLSTRLLLRYLVAYDFFQLLNSQVSGDSFPEGFARPEKVVKTFKKNKVDMYEVRWFYIPGTHVLAQKDLITTEMKNVFCAAFPKVASKFEGWNLKGDSDDDDDIEDDFDGYVPINTPGSPKKCVNNRKRARESSTETSTSKSTVNQYFVARKKLTFDTIK